MIRLVQDIPVYRQTRFPASTRFVSWDVHGRSYTGNRDFTELMQRLVFTFDQRGFAKGSKVCVLSGTGDVHLLAAEFALMRLGCIVVPLHEDLPVADQQYILSEIHPVCTLARTETAMQKLHAMQDTGEQIALDVLHTQPFEEDDFAESVCTPEDPALIIYTSGSTGVQKGVMLTHQNIVSTVLSVLAVIPLDFRQRVLSYLPVSHILERIALYCYLLAGVEVHFCESSRQAMSLLKKVKPHYITAVPRILDRALTNFEKAGDKKHYFLRSILLWAIDTDAKQHLFRTLIRKYVLRRLKRSFGRRLKGILVGGAALNPATQRLFQSAGIRVREGYGLSECCGVACLNRFEPGGNHPGTVGEPIPGVEIKILPSPGEGTGEVLIRSQGCMRGYFGRPDETALMFTEDGWLRTGDRGELVDGRFLKITGRIKEQFKNAYGEYVAPVRLEQLLEQDPWISRALITGGGRQYTGALIVPDFELLQAWAEKQKVHWTAPLYMVHNTQILQEMEERISRINKGLSPHEQIRRFRLVHDPWTVENGLLTASLKLRREVIEEKYRKTLDEMYG